jgi:hypothetical protein
MAGVASTAAPISAADRNFTLVIQFSPFDAKANRVRLLFGDGVVIRRIKGTHPHVASTLREGGVSLRFWNFSFLKSNLMGRDNFALTFFRIRHLSSITPGAVQDIRGFGNIGTEIQVLLSGDPRRCARTSHLRQQLRMPQVAMRPARQGT